VRGKVVRLCGFLPVVVDDRLWLDVSRKSLMTTRTYHLGRSTVLLLVYLVHDGDWTTLDVC
jgi:hypothetical protein